MDEKMTPAAPGPILDLEDLQVRYNLGKTKATEMASAPGFLNSVVDGMHRYPLAALEAWEMARSLAGTVAEPKPTAPTVVVAPPAPGRPGPRPAVAREVA
jgi:hypothetical protein